ncbi:MAG: GntR family transcriptional regulator [Acidobacteriota bacterium]
MASLTRVAQSGGGQLLSLRIDRTSPTPVYAQIAEGLQAFIPSGAFPPGTALPPERVLCEHYGVSRMTLRQAYDLLERDGLIECQRGRGTFVSPRRMEKQQHQMRSFSEDIRARGGVPSSQVLSLRLVNADGAAQQFFTLREQEQLYELRRVRLADGVPLALETTRIPSRLCPNLHRFDLANCSLYTILEDHYGLHLARCVEQISAELPNRQLCRLLNAPKIRAVLSIHRKTYAADDEPVELCHTMYRGDLYAAIVHSVRDHKAKDRDNGGLPFSQGKKESRSIGGPDVC